MRAYELSADGIMDLGNQYRLLLRSEKAERQRVITNVDGIYLWEHNGTRFTDLCSQKFNLTMGYSDTEIAQAIEKQIGINPYIGENNLVDIEAEYMRCILKYVPSNLKRVHFSDSYILAVYQLIKAVRKYTGRNKIIRISSLMYDMTKDLSEKDIVCIKNPEGYMTKADFTDMVIGEIIAAQPDAVAAVIVETLPYLHNAMIDTAFVEHLDMFCKNNGIMLVLDEAISGGGRLGDFFISKSLNCKPDAILFSDTLTGGYVPFGGFFAGDTLADFIREAYCRGEYNRNSFSIAFAAGIAMLNEQEKMKISDHVNMVGCTLEELLCIIKDKYPFVSYITGKGLFYCIHFDAKFFGENAEQIKKSIHNKRMFVKFSDNTLIIAPPLITKQEILDAFVNAIDAVLHGLTE